MDVLVHIERAVTGSGKIDGASRCDSTTSEDFQRGPFALSPQQFDGGLPALRLVELRFKQLSDTLVKDERTFQRPHLRWGTSRAGLRALVRYSFDDDLLDTGPHTFSAFQSGKSSVWLSLVYRYSGCRSVEIRDVPGDKDLPKLQGYFPLRSKGKLYLHFAMMTTDAGEELNSALAGP